MMTRRAFAQGLACAPLAEPALAQGAGDLRLVRYASLGGVTDAGLYLAEEYGFFREEGVRVEMQQIVSIPSLITAVATGQIDTAGVPLAPGLFAAARRGINLRFVGDKQSLRNGISATRLMVRNEVWKGDEAATVKALRDRPVAGPGRTSVGYFLAAQLLKKHGMSLDAIRFVELQVPSMIAGMTNGAIDAAVMIDPFMTQSVRMGVARVLSDLTEFVPPGGTIVPLVYSEAFAREKPVAQGFMNAYMRGVRRYNDAIKPGGDRAGALAIVAARMKADPAVVGAGYDMGLDPDQKLDRGFLATVQNFYIEQKLLDQPADFGALVDTSFAEAALAKFGPYK